MAKVIDLEGLPESIAKAIAEDVADLKTRYGAKREKREPLEPLPAGPGKVIGSLRRVDLYEDR